VTLPRDIIWAQYPIASADVGSGYNHAYVRAGNLDSLRDLIRLNHERGYRGHILHRPYGAVGEDTYREKAVGKSSNGRWDAVSRVFLVRDRDVNGDLCRDACRLIEEMPLEFPDDEFLIYVGGFDSPSFLECKPTVMFDRLQNFAPEVLNGPENVHLAVDHSETFEADSPSYRLMQAMNDAMGRGGKYVFVEALPDEDHPFHQWPCWVSERRVQHLKSRGMFTPTPYTIRVATPHDKVSDIKAWHQDVLDSGCIPGIQQHELIEQLGIA